MLQLRVPHEESQTAHRLVRDVERDLFRRDGPGMGALPPIPGPERHELYGGRHGADDLLDDRRDVRRRLLHELHTRSLRPHQEQLAMPTIFPLCWLRGGVPLWVPT